MERDDTETRDNKGRQCEEDSCDGTYQETSVFDDMDGVLHCERCGIEIKRYE